MFHRFFTPKLKQPFPSLTEKEILALAISSEEDDERIYLNYADGLRDEYPEFAQIFEKMAEEENHHRRRLIDLFIKRFGTHIPLIRREHVSGYYNRQPDWLIRPLGIHKVREAASEMEDQSARFYQTAAMQTQDAETRKLLGDLAMEEKHHEHMAYQLKEKYTPDTVQEKAQALEHKKFLLTWVQPGLAGLMDGSVSTLAPIFAAAFATGDTRQTFLVGLSASLGAGISMGFTEATHDDGKLSGRGSPFKRGLASGIMTTLGGLGHALPFLIPHFSVATAIAFLIVFFELWAIVWIQHKFMETPFWRASLQVILGGALVFATGILIGNA
ncbi:iron exporter MbfA [Bartonella tamiae]|uniref:Rubrerythrin diiron-binding domain-containing protein n=1 Tax=Bartonella tamiae Th239 TaxID=1094558 RepID=J1K3J9_9HYPH|nr:ferritin family protein [Bartonella tamiae]EJF91710.1 hypothetical protein ME5_00089 [Bartonella tamiae Th239]EJF92623.1 hypothetical protein MEG_01793 [Bartonella tamiae Th307]